MTNYQSLILKRVRYLLKKTVTLSPKSNKKNIQKEGAIIIEGHVQGLSNVRSLGEMGIPVFVVDKNNCIARYSKYCSKFFYCPDYKDDSFADFLIKIAIEENIHRWVILPSNDHAVLAISKNKKKLERFYKVITPELSILNNIYDKSKLLDIAKRNGIPIPNTYSFQSHNDQMPTNLSFPVITKGRFGLSFYKRLGRKAFYAQDSEILKTQLYEISSMYNLNETITQELIPFDNDHKTVSFTAFCVNGKIRTYWMGVKLREHPLRFGTATMAESVYIEDCLVQSRLLLEVLNYTGVCEIEYLFDPNDKLYKLIEINARTWLWVGLAKACGVDYVKIIYKYLNNEVIDYPTKYIIGMRWKNHFTNSIMYLKERTQNGNKSSFVRKKREKQKIIPAIFSNRDLLPSFVFLLMIPILFIKRT